MGLITAYSASRNYKPLQVSSTPKQYYSTLFVKQVLENQFIVLEKYICGLLSFKKLNEKQLFI